jgi:hypothetical protein
LDFYKELLCLRKRHTVLAELDSAAVDCTVVENCLIVRRSSEEQAVLLVFNFGDQATYLLPPPAGFWNNLSIRLKAKWDGQVARPAKSA